MSKSKVVLGTMAGLVTGAVAGILLSPEKGSVSRKQIKDKSDDYLDKLKLRFEKFSGSLSEKFKSTKNEAEEIADTGKENTDSRKNVRNAVTNFKHDNVAENKQAKYSFNCLKNKIYNYEKEYFRFYDYITQRKTV